MEKKHTLFTLHASLRDQGLYYVQGSKGIVIARKLSKENAELIVTAVNLHDELVEGLKDMRSLATRVSNYHIDDRESYDERMNKAREVLSKLPTQ